MKKTSFKLDENSEHDCRQFGVPEYITSSSKMEKIEFVEIKHWAILRCSLCNKLYSQFAEEINEIL